jgi:hypothetical protein
MAVLVMPNGRVMPCVRNSWVRRIFRTLFRNAAKPRRLSL